MMISESQERMVAVVRPQRLDEVEAVLRALGAPPRRDRRGDRDRRSCARSGTTRSSARSRRGFLTDECPRYAVEPAPRPEPRRSRQARRRARARRRRCSSCSARRTPQPRVRSTAATTSSSARAPCAGPGLDAAVLRLRPGYRGLAVSLDGQGRIGRARPAHRRRARRARGGAQRRLRRRRAARLHRLPQLRQPGEARDRLGARRGDRGDGARPARRSASRSSPATSRSTTRPTAARSTRRPSSAASASSRTCGACRAAGARATSILLAGARRSRSPARSTRRATARSAARPARLDLAAEAALVEFLWRAAPRCSLVHDVSERRPRRRARRGGAPLRARRRARRCPTTRAPVRRGRRPGGRSPAAPEVVDRLGGVPLRRIGVVGGDEPARARRSTSSREAHA